MTHIHRSAQFIHDAYRVLQHHSINSKRVSVTSQKSWPDHAQLKRVMHRCQLSRIWRLCPVSCPESVINFT